MSAPTYNPRCLKQLEKIDRYSLSPNQKSLAENIDHILTEGPKFTPDKIDEFKGIMDLLGIITDTFVDYKKDLTAGGDMLGDYLEQSNQTNARTGQFFTPMSVCKMQARMILTDEMMRREQPVTILDPACGSGRYMIALHDYYLQRDVCPNFIFYGDSLMMEYYRGYVVCPLSTPTGYVEWHPLSSEQALAVMLQQTPGETTEEKEAAIKTVTLSARASKQATLFET